MVTFRMIIICIFVVVTLRSLNVLFGHRNDNGRTYKSKCLWVLHSESPFNITGQLGRNGSIINLYYHKTSSATTSNFHDSTWPTNNNDNDDDDDNNEDNEDTGHVAPSTVNITNNIMLDTRLLNLGDRSSSARFYWIVLMKNIKIMLKYRLWR